MKTIRKILTVSALSASLFASVSFAQYHDDHHDDHSSNHHNDSSHYVHHDDWRKGRRMSSSDWSRGQRIDYRQYHLSAPQRGYEWREVDGNYVLAAAATGLISSVIIASTNH